MTLFSDQNRALTLSISAEGYPVLARADAECVGAEALQAGRWHHFAGIYDGSALTILIDGERMNTTAISPTIRAINSRPVIGAFVRNGVPSEPFLAADLAGFTLSARPLSPEESLLTTSGP